MYGEIILALIVHSCHDFLFAEVFLSLMIGRQYQMLKWMYMM